MITLLAALLPLTAHAQPEPPAPNSAQLARLGGLPALERTWSDTKYFVIFDTGASHNGVSASQPLTTTPGDTITILGVPVPLASFKPVPEIPRDNQSSTIILGRPFFDNQIVELDYGRNQVSVLAPQTFKQRRDEGTLGTELAVTDARLAVVTACITANDRTLGVSRVLIDTGSVQGLTVAPALRQRLDLSSAAGVEREILTVKGKQTLQQTDIPATLRAGALVVTAPVAWPTQTAIDYDIVIGTGVMKDSRLTIDLANRVIFAATSQRKNWGFSITPKSMSPLVIVTSNVVPDSPAGDGGLREDDKILTVADKPISAFTPATLYQLLSNPDTQTLALTIERAGTTTQIVLTRE